MIADIKLWMELISGVSPLPRSREKEVEGWGRAVDFQCFQGARIGGWDFRELAAGLVGQLLSERWSWKWRTIKTAGRCDILHFFMLISEPVPLSANRRGIWMWLKRLVHGTWHIQMAAFGSLRGVCITYLERKLISDFFDCWILLQQMTTDTQHLWMLTVVVRWWEHLLKAACSWLFWPCRAIASPTWFCDQDSGWAPNLIRMDRLT